jgi:hypothetical protein
VHLRGKNTFAGKLTEEMARDSSSQIISKQEMLVKLEGLEEKSSDTFSNRQMSGRSKKRRKHEGRLEREKEEKEEDEMSTILKKKKEKKKMMMMMMIIVVLGRKI